MRWQVANVALMNRLFDRSDTMPNAPAIPRTMNIYYQFNWSDNPYTAEPNDFVEVRARMTLLSPAVGASPAAIEVEYFLVDRSVNPVRYVSSMPGGVNYGQSVGGIRFSPHVTQLTRLDFHMIHDHVASITLEVDTYQVHSFPAVVPPAGFNFPGIYFLNVRPVGINSYCRFNVPPANVFTPPPNSQFSSITLSDFEVYEIPPPQNLRAHNPISQNILLGDDYNRVSFDVSWEVHLPHIRDYLMMSYGLLLDERSDFRMYMNLYISQDEVRMRNEFPGTNTNYQTFVRSPLRLLRDRHERRLALSDEELDETGTQPGSTINFHGEGRDALREYQTVAVTGLQIPPALWADTIAHPSVDGAGQDLEILTVTFTLDGLDKNQHTSYMPI
jgi:hypothetical protein